jgi:acetyl-CoA acetyltransferase
MTLRSVVIAEPVRTAIGAFGGTLKDVPAPDLDRRQRNRKLVMTNPVASVDRAGNSPAAWGRRSTNLLR